jgi:hypothetical protein
MKTFEKDTYVRIDIMVLILHKQGINMKQRNKTPKTNFCF